MCWNSNKHNKLIEIKPTLGEWKQSYRKKRREKVILFRLHIGHTRTTHSYLLEAKQQPTCHACQTEYTVKHILIECTNLAHIRETFYRANNMKELFRKIEMKNLISFREAVNLSEKSERIFNKTKFLRQTFPLEEMKVGDLSQGRPEDSLFNSLYTKV